MPAVPETLYIAHLKRVGRRKWQSEGHCPSRIITETKDEHLVAMEAKTVVTDGVVGAAAGLPGCAQFRQQTQDFPSL